MKVSGPPDHRFLLRSSTFERIVHFHVFVPFTLNMTDAPVLNFSKIIVISSVPTWNFLVH